MEKFIASLPDRPQAAVIRLGFTLLIMVLSALIQVGVFHLTGFNGFFLLLPGIFAAGVVFDRGSAFFATFLALSIATYITASAAPEDIASASVYEQVIPIFLFGVTGFAIAFVSEALRTTMERLIKLEKTKDVLLRELDHRTKNNMMSISSLLRLQAKVAANKETKDALRSSANRIQVMANVHEHLTGLSPDRPVSMSQYLEELCQRIEELAVASTVTLRCSVDETVLPEKKALPLAFVANELVTNSLKYAFPDNRQGVVNIDLKTDGEVVLTVSDNGVGRDPNAKEGLGTRLINIMVQQLAGTVAYEGMNPGHSVTVRVPQPERRTN
jgi:two-component system, sensor histidine kinase PdtaS